MTTLFNQFQSLILQSETSSGAQLSDMQEFGLFQAYCLGAASAHGQMTDFLEAATSLESIPMLLKQIQSLYHEACTAGQNVCAPGSSLVGAELQALADKEVFKAFKYQLEGLVPPMDDAEFYATPAATLTFAIFVSGMVNSLRVIFPGIETGETHKIVSPHQHMDDCLRQLETLRKAHTDMAQKVLPPEFANNPRRYRL